MATVYTVQKADLDNLLNAIEHIIPRPDSLIEQIDNFRALYTDQEDTHQHLWRVSMVGTNHKNEKDKIGTSFTVVECITCKVERTLGKSYITLNEEIQSEEIEN